MNGFFYYIIKYIKYKVHIEYIENELYRNNNDNK